MVGASAQMLFYVPREPRLFREGVEVTTQGSFTQTTASFTTAYLVERDLRTGDIIAITTEGEKDTPEFFRVDQIVAAYVGFQADNKDTTPERLYVVMETAIEADAEYNAAHEMYMDYLGIPF